MPHTVWCANDVAVHLWWGLGAHDSTWAPRHMVLSARLDRPLTSACLSKIMQLKHVNHLWINQLLAFGLFLMSWQKWGHLCAALLENACQVWNDELTGFERCEAWCHCQELEWQRMDQSAVELQGMLQMQLGGHIKDGVAWLHQKLHTFWVVGKQMP